MNKSLNTTMNKNRISIQDMTLIALFTALIAVGAFIRIPTPFIPITFQVFFVLLAALLLGPKLGAYSGILYMVLGLVGVPIFAEGGGMGYIFRPTFGYIIGFCVGAYVAGKIAERYKNPNFKQWMMANLAGILVIYVFGVVYFYIISNFVINIPIGVGPLFLYCFVMVIPGDIITAVLASIIAKRLRPVVKRSLKHN
jgi:biotin transport system substrate-specific component